MGRRLPPGADDPETSSCGHPPRACPTHFLLGRTQMAHFMIGFPILIPRAAFTAARALAVTKHRSTFHAAYVAMCRAAGQRGYFQFSFLLNALWHARPDLAEWRVWGPFNDTEAEERPRLGVMPIWPGAHLRFVPGQCRAFLLLAALCQPGPAVPAELGESCRLLHRTTNVYWPYWLHPDCQKCFHRQADEALPRVPTPACPCRFVQQCADRLEMAFLTPPPLFGRSELPIAESDRSHWVWPPPSLMCYESLRFRKLGVLCGFRYSRPLFPQELGRNGTGAASRLGLGQVGESCILA